MQTLPILLLQGTIHPAQTVMTSSQPLVELPDSQLPFGDSSQLLPIEPGGAGFASVFAGLNQLPESAVSLDAASNTRILESAQSQVALDGGLATAVPGRHNQLAPRGQTNDAVGDLVQVKLPGIDTGNALPAAGGFLPPTALPSTDLDAVLTPLLNNTALTDESPQTNTENTPSNVLTDGQAIELPRSTDQQGATSNSIREDVLTLGIDAPAEIIDAPAEFIWDAPQVPMRDPVVAAESPDKTQPTTVLTSSQILDTEVPATHITSTQAFDPSGPDAWTAPAFSAPINGPIAIESSTIEPDSLAKSATEQASSINQFIARTRAVQQTGFVGKLTDPSAVAGPAALQGVNLTKDLARAANADLIVDPKAIELRPLSLALTEPGTISRHVNLQLAGSAWLNPGNSQATVEPMPTNTAMAELATQDLPDSPSINNAAVKKADSSGSSLAAGLASHTDIAGKSPTSEGPLSFRQAGWSEALSQRITLLQGKNIDQAQIQLDPPELGPLQVKINMQGDQVSVQFTSTHGVVREALEHTSVRLAQLFSEEGIELLDVSVSDGRSEGDGQAPAKAGVGEDFDTDPALGDENLTPLVITPLNNGQIDYFV